MVERSLGQDLGETLALEKLKHLPETTPSRCPKVLLMKQVCISHLQVQPSKNENCPVHPLEWILIFSTEFEETSESIYSELVAYPGNYFLHSNFHLFWHLAPSYLFEPFFHQAVMILITGLWYIDCSQQILKSDIIWAWGKYVYWLWGINKRAFLVCVCLEVETQAVKQKLEYLMNLVLFNSRPWLVGKIKYFKFSEWIL